MTHNTQAAGAATLTDAQIIDLADEFKSQYQHGGTTFDEFDALGFGKALLSRASQMPTVTDDMVTTYLKANDEYWRRTDKLPGRADKWRKGTPQEATRESLIAALASTATAPSAPTRAKLEEWQRDGTLIDRVIGTLAEQEREIIALAAPTAPASAPIAEPLSERDRFMRDELGWKPPASAPATQAPTPGEAHER